MKITTLNTWANLKWDDHIKYIKSKILSVIGVMFKMRRKLNTKTRLSIPFHLEYVVAAYAYKTSNELKSLQIAQNKTIK